MTNLENPLATQIRSGRNLIASINDTEVGVLNADDDIWSFSYLPSWLERADRYPLSPALPLQEQAHRDGATRRSVQWYFDNLLPEEAQRSLLARDAAIRDEADAFALLAHYGAESAGSVTLLRPGTPFQPVATERPLPDEALQARIDALPRVPLTHGAIKRMSLAGAQHKLAVVLRGDAIYEPGGALPSTHILKPNHQDNDDYPHSVINEWFLMMLARRMRLGVPLVHRRYVPSPVYLIDRFDREQQAGAWRRLHMIDACQLLDLARTFKYDQGSVEQLATLAARCRNQASARTRLFSWLVFNVLIGNSDAHLKNLSFLVSAEGIQLAPFYDLLSVGTYGTASYQKTEWPTRTTFAWDILGTRYFDDFDRALMLRAGETLGLARKTAERLLDALAASIVRVAAGLYEEVEQQNAALLVEKPHLAATFGGELRCLRTIRYAVIADMAGRLTAS